jgi:hypothetical protein
VVEDQQSDLLSPVSDLQLVRCLLADLHDDLPGKIARFRQLSDLSEALGSHGTMMAAFLMTLCQIELHSVIRSCGALKIK